MGTRESKILSSSAISGLASSSSTLSASTTTRLTASDRLAPSIKSVYYCDHDKGAIWSDLLTTDLLEYIPDHWSQFEPPSSCTNLLLAILYFLIFVFGCGGNGLVIVLYLKYIFNFNSISIQSNFRINSQQLVIQFVSPFIIFCPETRNCEVRPICYYLIWRLLISSWSSRLQCSFIIQSNVDQLLVP